MLIYAFVDRIDDIISLVFQYVNMLKREGVQEWIFKEERVSCMASMSKYNHLDVSFALSKAKQMRKCTLCRNEHAHCPRDLDRVVSRTLIMIYNGSK